MSSNIGLPLLSLWTSPKTALNLSPTSATFGSDALSPYLNCLATASLISFGILAVKGNLKSFLISNNISLTCLVTSPISWLVSI